MVSFCRIPRGVSPMPRIVRDEWTGMVERKGAGVTDKALNLTEQAFLHAISQELEQGDLRFPTSMEVTMRVAVVRSGQSCGAVGIRLLATLEG